MRGDLPEKPMDEDIISRGLEDEMWGLMTHCWNSESAQRPSAKFMSRRLQAVAKFRGKSGRSLRACKRARPEQSDREARTKKAKAEPIHVKEEEV